MPLTVGCDPEFFLVNNYGDNISAHDILPVTKEDPHELDGGACQAVGTAG